MFKMCDGELTADDRSAMRRLQRAMGGLLLLYVTVQTMGHFRPHAVPLAITAGVQGAALFGMFVTFGFIARRRFRGTVNGALNAQALLWGSALTMLLVMVWGFEEVFAPGAVKHLPLLVVPAMVVGFSVLAKLFLMALRTRTR